MQSRPYRVVDLFAGCGGITEGFRRTGRYKAVAAVEVDVAAASTYAENFGEDHMWQGSITDWLKDHPAPEADVVVGGPPCQGFSNLGAKRDDDPRNELWREYVRVLNLIKPRVFLIENVPQFLQSNQFAALEAQTEDGGLLSDYMLEKKPLVAVDYGSAQVRRRGIVIGTHRDLVKSIEIPDPTVAVEDRRTVRTALLGVNGRVPVDRRDLPKTMTVEHFGATVPGAYTGYDLHVTRHYEPISLERFKFIGPGENRFSLPDHLKSECWRKHTTGAADVMGRLRWDKPSVTIRTEFFKPEKGRYLHPSEDRAITHREAALLQGFEDDFRWCGTKIEIARQIGNAVPVEFAEALGEHIAKALDDRR